MNDVLWQRVEADLDQRRDPFDDVALSAELAKEPATLAAARRLVRRLELLPEPVQRERGPHRRWVRRTAVAAGLVALIALVARVNEVAGVSGEVPAVGPPAESVAAATMLPSAPRVPAGRAISLVVETTQPRVARCARVVLEPRRLFAWNLEER